jgi:flagellar protein FlaJ
MNFSRFWPRRSTKGSSKRQRVDGEYLSYDLFYQLAYMSSIAAAGISRSKIFEFASQLNCSSSQYFAEIHLLAKQMRYDYAVACRIVGERTEEDRAKSLLLRLASSLNSGEAEADFLAQEAQVQAEAFKNEYERGVESLRKWTEGYAALIVSAALIVMVAAISMIIYPVATSFTVTLVVVTICVAVLGAWAIYRVAPKEVRFHVPASYCGAYKRARWLGRVLLPAAAACFFMFLLSGLGLGWALIIASLMVIPVGVVGGLFDRQFKRKDTDISTFLRSLGNVASAVGITVSNALERLDLRSTSNLAGDVKRLQSRLDSRLKPEMCWQRFSLETGSETVYRSVKMFHDANRLGGDPEEVGNRSSVVAMTLDFLRAKRNQVSSSFGLLAIGMHAALVALLVFVVQVILMFAATVDGVYTQAVSQAQTKAVEVFSFNFQSVQLLETLALPCIVVLSITNAFAIRAADGGNGYKIFTYLGTTLGLAGVGLVIVPMLADKIFGSIQMM